MDSDGTYVYEGGGYAFSAADNINQFGRFDPVANTWTPLAAVPDLNNAKASGVYAPNVNKLFVFGGDDPNAARWSIPPASTTSPLKVDYRSAHA